jgi:hypothetical protein
VGPMQHELLCDEATYTGQVVLFDGDWRGR